MLYVECFTHNRAFAAETTKSRRRRRSRRDARTCCSMRCKGAFSLRLFVVCSRVVKIEGESVIERERALQIEHRGMCAVQWFSKPVNSM